MFAQRPIIGIAGGIGAGKSYVSRLLSQLGCCLVDSDEMVRAAYTHPTVKRDVLVRFGEAVFDTAGQVDRKALGKVVFDDPSQRRWLEELLHPIANRARVEVMTAAASNPSIIAYVWDSPLLFEVGLNRLCDTVIFVDAPHGDRLLRVADRGWDAAELDRREKVQMPLDKKEQSAQYRITNAIANPATLPRVRAILDEIVSRIQPQGGHCGDPGKACASGHACACAAASQSGD